MLNQEKFASSPAKFSVAPDVDQLQKTADSIEGTEAQFKDKLFYEYAKQAVAGAFFDRMADYIDQDDIDRMRSVLVDYSDEDILSVISLPEELVEKNFSDFEKRIIGGESPEEVMRSYIDRVSKYKFSIGFHTSPFEIKQNEDTGSWSIKGRQNDHRDGDRPMAYYSKQYRHLYKKDKVNYIYVVRASPEDKTDDNWYRNSSLSIIARLDLREALQYVETYARQRKDSADTKSTEP
ncbi:MAG: hypothetical protein AAB618_01505 [Patescibacteria group bacterium]